MTTANNIPTRSLWYGGLALVLVVTVAGCTVAYGLRAPEKPDFSQIESVDERKAAFFDYLLPRVETSNREILQTRRELIALRDDLPNISNRRLRKVMRIAETYDIEDFQASSDDDWDTLLRRVDIVPPSLALAQAANESAWGTSRFANQGSNFFGQWCFDPGCGIVPKQRPADATYEVADFNSVQHSVDRYIHNLNQHPAYTELRMIRAELREQGKMVTGMALAEGLEEYSERGAEYIDLIRTIISANDLGRLDKQA